MATTITKFYFFKLVFVQAKIPFFRIIGWTET